MRKLVGGRGKQKYGSGISTGAICTVVDFGPVKSSLAHGAPMSGSTCSAFINGSSV